MHFVTEKTELQLFKPAVEAVTFVCLTRILLRATVGASVITDVFQNLSLINGAFRLY